MMELLFDPLFRVPFFVGAFISLLLPILGIYLRLREEWLAALGLAQVSAAAGMIGFVLHIPVIAAGLMGALAMALLKSLSRSGNNAYALMILGGWSMTFVIAANTGTAQHLGQSLSDGQLYFTGRMHLWASGIVALLGLMFLRWASSRLLRARLFPHYERLNETARWRWHIGFDATVAMAMAVATTTIGLMAAFATVFIPAWLAFRIAPSWRMSIVYATGFSVCAYLVSFVVAVVADQPFGPVMVGVQVCAALVVLLYHLPQSVKS